MPVGLQGAGSRGWGACGGGQGQPPDCAVKVRGLLWWWSCPYPLCWLPGDRTSQKENNTTHTYTHDTPWQSQAGPFPPTRSQRLPYQVLALGTAELSFHPVRGIGGTHSAGVRLVLGPAASMMCLSFLSSGYCVAVHRWAPLSDSFGFLPCVSWRSPRNPAHLLLENLLC